MGCRLSRSDSVEIDDSPQPQPRHPGKKDEEKRLQGQVTNGQSVLTRRDTPAAGLLDGKNGHQGGQTRVPPLVSSTNNNAPVLQKPIGYDMSMRPMTEVESASQADFFRMLDEKIAHGAKGLVESDVDE